LNFNHTISHCAVAPIKEEDLPDSPSKNNATANPNPTLQSLQINFTQELFKNISEKLKSTEEKLEAKTAKLDQELEVQQKNLASLNQSVASKVAKAVSSHFEKMEIKVEILSLKFSEAKALLDLERKDRELIQSKCANEKSVLELKVGKLEQAISDLKKESQDRENTLRQEFVEIISKKLEEFEFKFSNKRGLEFSLNFSRILNLVFANFVEWKKKQYWFKTLTD
jgi:hypothetical protein